MAKFDHTNERYSKVERAALAALVGYAIALRRGRLSVDEFGDAVRKKLKGWHTAAAKAGREAAEAETAEPDEEAETTEGPSGIDEEIGEAAAEKETVFLEGFLDSIRDGRYEPEMRAGAEAGDKSALTRRLEMYGMALLASAMEGWVRAIFAGESGMKIAWNSEPDACAGCAEIGRNSPYSQEDLPTYPGAGDTPCLSLCRCWLEVV